MPATVHRTVADGMTIVALAVKIGNANTRKLDRNVGAFSCFLEIFALEW